jgi:hypothetical protein
VKKLLCILSVLLLLCTFAKAQSKRSLNIIGVEIDYVQAVDINEGVTGLRYSIDFIRELKSTKYELAGKLGIINLPNSRTNFINSSDGFDLPKRPGITGDLTLLHSIIQNQSHKLFAGIGPSLWFFRDVLQSRITKPVLLDNSIILATAIIDNTANEVVWGGHIVVGYKFVSPSGITLISRGGYTGLTKAKTNFFAGILLGYQF